MSVDPAEGCGALGAGAAGIGAGGMTFATGSCAALAIVCVAPCTTFETGATGISGETLGAGAFGVVAAFGVAGAFTGGAAFDTGATSTGEAGLAGAGSVTCAGL